MKFIALVIFLEKQPIKTYMTDSSYRIDVGGAEVSILF